MELQTEASRKVPMEERCRGDAPRSKSPLLKPGDLVETVAERILTTSGRHWCVTPVCHADDGPAEHATARGVTSDVCVTGACACASCGSLRVAISYLEYSGVPVAPREKEVTKMYKFEVHDPITFNYRAAFLSVGAHPTVSSCVVACQVLLCCVLGCVAWCGVVWCGVVWCGVVWCGVVWCGVVWCGVVWCGVVWCGVVWCGVVWCGVV